jgi:glycerophosphoryl diester phosphodiesterase
MARYVKGGDVARVPQINSELEAIETAQKDFLTRSGEAPNEMLANLDMNSHTLLNLAAPVSQNSPVRLADIDALLSGGTTQIVKELPSVAKESVVLTSGQSIVQFSEVLVDNASVYITGAVADNTRLHETLDYIPRLDINDLALELLTTYPAGTTVTAYSYGLNTTTGSFNTDNKKLEVIAHRGFLDSFPQNTMLAFTSAIRRGADSLECDVQVTSDGVPVIFHDSTVDALTNGTGAISSLTLTQVQALVIDEVAGTAFSGTRIPTFAELLDYCKSAGIKLYPEVKKYRTQVDIAIMIQATIDAGMEFQTFFSSFDLTDVQYFKTLNSDILCGLLGSSSDPLVYEPLIDTLEALGNTSIVWQDIAIITDPDVVTYARERGIDVQSWTVASNTRAKELMKLGVYKIITDRKLEVL